MMFGWFRKEREPVSDWIENDPRLRNIEWVRQRDIEAHKQKQPWFAVEYDRPTAAQKLGLKDRDGNWVLYTLVCCHEAHPGEYGRYLRDLADEIERRYPS